MARTAIPIGDSPPWLAGVNLTAAVGTTDGMSVNVDDTPVAVMAMNYHTGTVAISMEVPASSLTFGEALSLSWTLPAATAGIAQPRITVITNPNIKDGTTGLFHIDSADANVSNVRFYAFKWSQTVP